MAFMHSWIGAHTAGHYGVLSRLTKDAVRNHQNIRKQGDASASSVSATTHGHGAAVNSSHPTAGHSGAGGISSAIG